ncbi:hypothetical protein BJV74DRAFT_846047 [Russula compacta]|nr:hypothetical protein BJV74DRAFT_846047 [Russula compacta]
MRAHSSATVPPTPPLSSFPNQRSDSDTLLTLAGTSSCSRILFRCLDVPLCNALHHPLQNGPLHPQCEGRGSGKGISLLAMAEQVRAWLSGTNRLKLGLNYAPGFAA